MPFESRDTVAEVVSVRTRVSRSFSKVVFANPSVSFRFRSVFRDMRRNHITPTTSQ